MDSISRRHFLAAASLGAWPTSLLSFKENKAANPFLEGNYAPIREEITAANLPVVGQLPEGLEGLFVRNGPNPQFPPRSAYHWFDGDGMLHGVRLQGGKASYRNRYVRTEGWHEERRAGKALYDGLLGLPNFAKIAQGKDGYKNAANTALVWYNGQLLALWEGGAPHAVRVPSLETIGPFNFAGKLRHACTAHPRIDPATGEFLFFGYQPVAPYLQYSIADARGNLTRTTAIELPRPVMMHDFAITARHTLFLDLPLVFTFTRLAQGQSPFGYEPDRGARIGVLPRHGRGSEIRWFEVQPGVVFHTLNAHDEEDAVVLHACRLKNFPRELTPPEQMSVAESKEYGAVLYRWRLDLKKGTVSEGPVSDLPADFPRINETLTGRQTRFGYLMPLKMDAHLKVDLQKGTTQRHELGKGRLGGECVFVPRPGGKGEDDGWLLGYVYDRTTNRSELLVLDARDFTSKPLARVLLPTRVPFGFHGTWLPGEAIADS